MIYFDELSVAEKMENNQSFSNGYSRIELNIYAKYLKYKKFIENNIDYFSATAQTLKEYDVYVERELRAFCERCCSTFNYTTDYNDIDVAVDNSSKYLLKLPRPLPITQSEWEAIQSIKNEKYKRMLFVMLVDAKYYRMYNSSVEKKTDNLKDDVFYVRMTRSEIKKLAKIKYDNDSEKVFFLGCISKMGLFGITENRLRTWFIKFVDLSNKNIIDYITDYRHIDMHFDKINGDNIGICEYCGGLFKQNKNRTARFCYKHRGRQKKELPETMVCDICGCLFPITSRTKRTCCKKCYTQNRYKKMNSYKVSDNDTE